MSLAPAEAAKNLRNAPASSIILQNKGMLADIIKEKAPVPFKGQAPSTAGMFSTGQKSLFL